MPIGTAVRYLKKREWEKAHVIVQEDASTLGCWAHGIVHMQEGDIANARHPGIVKCTATAPRPSTSGGNTALARAIKDGAR